MNIAFRVDACAASGTGHLMRCLTLADALKQHGSRVRFVSRRMLGYLKELLTARGHEFQQLESHRSTDVADELQHSSWLGVSQSTDALDTKRALADWSYDWLVVDHYALDYRWESAMREVAKKVLVIDDLADRQHDCDILLDQNFYKDMATRYQNRVPPSCRVLAGPRFALLRDEFLVARESVEPRSSSVGRVLISFGGVDAENYTVRAMDALSELSIPNVKVDVVIGAKHQFKEHIESECNKRGFTCYVQTSEMARLMSAADLAIGAGGASIWERCSLALPTFAICAAENQKRQIADAAAECWVYAPQLHTVEVATLKRHLLALIENPQLMHFISTNCMLAVDGRGVSRVRRSMMTSELDIRLATSADSEALFNWRNHASIREVSRNPEEIIWSVHQQWMTSTLNDEDKFLLIAECAGLPVGVVRFQVCEQWAEISIYLVPQGEPNVLGRDLLFSAEAWLRSRQPNLCGIRACVLGSNQRSHRLFLDANYRVASSFYSKAFR